MPSSPKPRIMLDLETLGTDPGAAILSVGAVRFDAEGLGEEFHRSISIQSNEDAGLSFDADTLEWWLEQDDAAQEVLTGGDELATVLFDFDTFYHDADEIWAYSPQFDCAILDHAYEAVDQTAPWSYRDERCARTVANLPGAPRVDREGTAHDALDDARNQARQVTATLCEVDNAE